MLTLESFEEAAFSLTSGQNSGLVEAEDGYYIIKCINDYLEKETEENKVSMRKKHKAEAFLKIYRPFLENQDVEFNNKVWDKISMEEYQDCSTDRLYEVYYACKI